MNYMYNWHNFDMGRSMFWFFAPLGIVGELVMAAFIVVVVIWSLIWKGMALWKAAHHNSRGWFIALLLVNTFGILDILYIYVFSKKHKQAKE